MATKKKFIKTLKDVKKDALSSVLASGIRGGAFLGSAFTANHLVPKIPGINKVPAKFHGPGFLVLGLLGEAFISDDKKEIKAIAEGMSTFGIVKSASELMPAEHKPKFGLAGLGASNDSNVSNFDWKALLAEAEKDAPVTRLNESDYSSDMSINGTDDNAYVNESVSGTHDLKQNAALML